MVRIHIPHSSHLNIGFQRFKHHDIALEVNSVINPWHKRKPKWFSCVRHDHTCWDHSCITHDVQPSVMQLEYPNMSVNKPCAPLKQLAFSYYAWTWCTLKRHLLSLCMTTVYSDEKYHLVWAQCSLMKSTILINYHVLRL